MKKNIEKSKPSFILLIILLGFPQLHEAMFAPSLQALSASYSIPLNQAQQAISVYFVAFALGVLFWGTYSDKTGRRKALLYGYLLFCLGTGLALLKLSFGFFLGARAFIAFGCASGSVVTQTILREAFSEDQRNQLFSQVSLALALVPGFGPLLGGFILDFSGLQTLLYVLLLMGCFIVFITKLRLPETRIAQTENISFSLTAKKMAKTPSVWIYGFCIAALNAIMSCYYVEAPYLFKLHFNLSLTETGSFGIFLALATILGALVTQVALKKYKPTQLILAGTGIMLLGSLLMIAVSFVEPNLWVLALYIFGMFCIRFGSALALSNAISLALVGFESVYGTAGSILSLCYYLGISALLNLSGQLRNDTLWIMPLYFSVLILMMVFFVSLNHKSRNS